MPNIEQLKGTISRHGGLAKSNRFKVILPFIPNAKLVPIEMDIFCNTVTLPGKQIATVDKLVGGLASKIPYGQVFVESNMNFIVPEDFGIRQYFAEWQKLVFNPETLEPGYKTDYAKSIYIQQLSSRKSGIELGISRRGFNIEYDYSEYPVYELELRKAYPIQIGEVEYTNELNGLVSLNVGFSFDRYSEKYLK